MQPQTLNLESFTAGDTFQGIPSIAIRRSVEGVVSPPASALQSVRMRFAKLDRNPQSVVELTSTGGGVVITDAVAWEFNVPAQNITGLTSGRWRWTIETTAADAIPTVETYLTGEITILEDV
jgi:hypothetical protein